MTQRQAEFAKAYVEHEFDASAAYRHAYSTENMLPTSVNRKAHDVLHHPKVQKRIAELQARAMVRHDVTVDDLVRELDEARELAMTSTSSVSTAVQATMAKAKLLGLIPKEGPSESEEGLSRLLDAAARAIEANTPDRAIDITPDDAFVVTGGDET